MDRINPDALTAKIVRGDRLTDAERAWLDERRVLRKDPAIRLLLDMGRAQEEVREGEMGVAIRRASGLLPTPETMTPAERYHVAFTRKFL